MIAATQGIANQLSPPSAEAKSAVVKPNATRQDNSSAENPASIAANNFLTLLVTEMKNQDPTATTDPNEWVNQLVQVNSLQQLISINETLKGSTGTRTNADSVSSLNNGEAKSLEATAIPRASQDASTTASIPVTRQAGMPNANAAALQIATAMTSR